MAVHGRAVFDILSLISTAIPARDESIMRMKIFFTLLLVTAPSIRAQEGKVMPTWLHRYAPGIHEQRVDLTSASCHYAPIFGDGDAESDVPRSVARFGEVTVEGNGRCEPVTYPRQEELYFVLAGSGTLHYAAVTHSMRANDFVYVPPAVPHSIASSPEQPLRIVLATVKIPPGVAISAPPPEPAIANLDELKEQTVEGHPASVLYKLLIGPRHTARDHISAAYEVADFFFMDFAPGGTNLPHHHEVEEEMYLVLDGAGKMAAGGGLDGVEGLHPAKAGDAYYFRPNCTVGFYNEDAPGAKAHILALRAFVPLPRNPD
jgi:mannose-6-phosphate isomerase-like protein (cupin superfamily)